MHVLDAELEALLEELPVDLDRQSQHGKGPRLNLVDDRPRLGEDLRTGGAERERVVQGEVEATQRVRHKVGLEAAGLGGAPARALLGTPPRRARRHELARANAPTPGFSTNLESSATKRLIVAPRGRIDLAGTSLGLLPPTTSDSVRSGGCSCRPEP